MNIYDEALSSIHILLGRVDGELLQVLRKALL